MEMRFLLAASILVLLVGTVVYAVDFSLETFFDTLKMIFSTIISAVQSILMSFMGAVQQFSDTKCEIPTPTGCITHVFRDIPGQVVGCFGKTPLGDPLFSVGERCDDYVLDKYGAVASNTQIRDLEISSFISGDKDVIKGFLVLSNDGTTKGQVIADVSLFKPKLFGSDELLIQDFIGRVNVRVGKMDHFESWKIKLPFNIKPGKYELVAGLATGQPYMNEAGEEAREVVKIQVFEDRTWTAIG